LVEGLGKDHRGGRAILARGDSLRDGADITFDTMAEESGLHYEFKLFGSAYRYSSQSWFYRWMTVSFAVWIAGLLLISLSIYAGGLVVLAGAGLGLYILEKGYRRGKGSS